MKNCNNKTGCTLMKLDATKKKNQQFFFSSIKPNNCARYRLDVKMKKFRNDK